MFDKANKIISSEFSSIEVLSVYGFTHAVVDATCAAMLFRLYTLNILSLAYLAKLFLLYNILAFGTQFLFGILVDKFHLPRVAAIFGCGLLLVAVLIFTQSPLLAAILAGLGNSFFHIGGGAISLKISPPKSGPPGIFVAPGVIGLLVGTLFGKSLYFSSMIICLVLLFCVLGMLLVRIPLVYASFEQKKFNWFGVILILLLFSIFTRSLIGLAIAFPWKSNMWLLVVLTIGVALGKSLGGVLSDRFGWTKVTVGCLIISAPLLAFANVYPYLAIPAMMLFQMTMPVTLAAISRSLPKFPAFAFGLACLAILLGALPIFSAYKSMFANSWIVFSFVFVSALTLWGGLRLFFKNVS